MPFSYVPFMCHFSNYTYIIQKNEFTVPALETFNIKHLLLYVYKKERTCMIYVHYICERVTYLTRFFLKTLKHKKISANRYRHIYICKYIYFVVGFWVFIL